MRIQDKAERTAEPAKAIEESTATPTTIPFAAMATAGGQPQAITLYADPREQFDYVRRLNQQAIAKQQEDKISAMVGHKGYIGNARPGMKDRYGKKMEVSRLYWECRLIIDLFGEQSPAIETEIAVKEKWCAESNYAYIPVRKGFTLTQDMVFQAKQQVKP